MKKVQYTLALATVIAVVLALSINGAQSGYLWKVGSIAAGTAVAVLCVRLYFLSKRLQRHSVSNS